MSGSYNKKLVVPAVALMMCAVAFIGIGYALTSSVTIENNELSDVFKVELKDNSDNYIGSGEFSNTTSDIFSTIQLNNVLTYKIDEGSYKIASGKLIVFSNHSFNSLNILLDTTINNGSVAGITESNAEFALKSGGNAITTVNDLQPTGSDTIGYTATIPIDLYMTIEDDDDSKNYIELGTNPPTLKYTVTINVTNN